MKQVITKSIEVDPFKRYAKDIMTEVYHTLVDLELYTDWDEWVIVNFYILDVEFSQKKVQ